MVILLKYCSYPIERTMHAHADKMGTAGHHANILLTKHVHGPHEGHCSKTEMFFIHFEYSFIKTMHFPIHSDMKGQYHCIVYCYWYEGRARM